METKDAQELIQDFLNALGVAPESLEKSIVAGHTMYNVRSNHSKLLIGPQGEHLRMINYLLRRMAERVEALKEDKFFVDVDGYHHTQVREIEQKASILAERVRTFRSSVEMSPMNSYERMIIHAMFSDDPDIETESDGFGSMRHIVLKCRADKK